jgi:hypothetical protein
MGLQERNPSTSNNFSDEALPLSIKQYGKEE